MATKTITFLAVYFVIAFLFIIISLLFQKKKKAEYDERQIAVRATAFKYGFLTMFIGLIIQIVLITGFQFGIEIYYLTSVVIFCSGLSVYCIYAIWNDAYIGINTNAKSAIIVDALAFLFNLIAGLINISENPINPETGYRSGLLNLALAVSFGVILLTMIIKHFKDRSED